jgi:hypothetical protein
MDNPNSKMKSKRVHVTCAELVKLYKQLSAAIH